MLPEIIPEMLRSVAVIMLNDVEDHVGRNLGSAFHPLVVGKYPDDAVDTAR